MRVDHSVNRLFPASSMPSIEHTTTSRPVNRMYEVDLHLPAGSSAHVEKTDHRRLIVGPAIVRMYTNAPLKAISPATNVTLSTCIADQQRGSDNERPEVTVHDVDDSAAMAASDNNINDDHSALKAPSEPSILTLSEETGVKMPSTTPAPLVNAHHRQFPTDKVSDAGKQTKPFNGKSVQSNVASVVKLSGINKAEKRRVSGVSGKDSDLSPFPAHATNGSGKITLLNRKTDVAAVASSNVQNYSTKSVVNGIYNIRNGGITIKLRMPSDGAKFAGENSDTKSKSAQLALPETSHEQKKHEVFEAIAPDGSIIRIALMPTAPQFNAANAGKTANIFGDTTLSAASDSSTMTRSGVARDASTEQQPQNAKESVPTNRSPGPTSELLKQPIGSQSSAVASSLSALPAVLKSHSGRNSKASSSRGTPQPHSPVTSAYTSGLHQPQNYPSSMLSNGNFNSDPNAVITPAHAAGVAAMFQQQHQNYAANVRQRLPLQMQHAPVLPFVTVGNEAEFLARLRPVRMLPHNSTVNVVTTGGPHMHGNHRTQQQQPRFNSQQQPHHSSPIPPNVNGAHHMAQFIAAAMQHQQQQQFSHSRYQHPPYQNNNFHNANVMPAPHHQQYYPGSVHAVNPSGNKPYADHLPTHSAMSNISSSPFPTVAADGGGDTLVRPGTKGRAGPSSSWAQNNLKSVPRSESFRRRSVNLTGIREHRKIQHQIDKHQRQQKSVLNEVPDATGLSTISPVSAPAKGNTAESAENFSLSPANSAQNNSDVSKSVNNEISEMQRFAQNNGAAAATMAATSKSRSPSPRPESSNNSFQKRTSITAPVDESTADLRSSAAPSPAASSLSAVSGGGMLSNGDPLFLQHYYGVGMSSSPENSSICTDDLEDVEAEAELLLRLLSEIAESPPRADVLRSREAVICLPSPDVDKIHPYFVVEEQDFTYEVRIAEMGRTAVPHPDADTVSEKLIYAGPARSQLLIDQLRPATTYRLRYCVNLDEMRSAPSKALEFTTLADVPSRPLLPPQLQERKKNALALKWPAPVVATDNGSKIQRYVLEYTYPSSDDNENSSSFEQIYSGPNKSFKVAKLTPSTTYRFRLAAENDIGRSEYSDTAAYATSGTAPGRPKPPVVFYITACEIGLSWEEAAPRGSALPATSATTAVHDVVDSYTVEMKTLADSTFGYMPVYAASAEHGTQCYVNGLLRCAKYRFRLRAENEEGASQWSEPTECETLPQLPQSPAKPKLKGRAHARYFRVAWAPPDDTGGAPITSYFLECNMGGSGDGFVPVYEGPDVEATCTDLEPGVAYPVRVRCATRAGTSEYTPVAVFTTNSLPPGACSFLKLVGKVRATQVQLRWGAPPSDGGAKLISFTFQMAQTGDCEGKWLTSSNANSANAVQEEVNARLDFHDVVVLSTTTNSDDSAVVSTNEYLVSDLSAGCWYAFRVRASNSAGDGEWTEPLHVQTGPGVPDAPHITDIRSSIPHQLHVEWQAPRRHNGAPPTHYRLFFGEALSSSSAIVPLPADAANSAAQLPAKTNLTEIYSGLNTCFDIQKLKPVTRYLVAVACSNSAGWSEMSEPVEGLTMPSVPGQVNLLSVADNNAGDTDASSPPLITATAVSLHWAEPETNGSPIVSYKLDYYNMSVSSSGNNGEPSPSPSHAAALKTLLIENGAVHRRQALLDRLQPDSLYKIRIRASNAAGEGPLSAPLQLRTLPLKPEAPKLTLLSSTHNSAKLKWTDLDAVAAAAKLAPAVDEYVLEMTAPDKSDVFQVIYRGTMNVFKVGSLRSYTRYAFRAYATNVAGQGNYSSVLECRTEEEPPLPVRGLKVTDVDKTVCVVHWDISSASLKLNRHGHNSAEVSHTGPMEISGNGAGFAALHPELVVHAPAGDVVADSSSADASADATAALSTKNSSEADSDNEDDRDSTFSSETLSATGGLNNSSLLAVTAGGGKQHARQAKPEQPLTYHVQLSSDNRHFETVGNCTSSSSYRLQSLSPNHTYQVRVVVKCAGVRSGKELTSPFSTVIQFSTLKHGAAANVSANQITETLRTRHTGSHKTQSRRDSAVASTSATPSADVTEKQQQKPAVKKLAKSKKNSSWLVTNPHVISLVAVLTLIVFFAVAAIFVSNPSANINNTMPNNREQHHSTYSPSHRQQHEHTAANQQQPQTLPPPPPQVLMRQSSPSSMLSPQVVPTMTH